MLLGLLRSLKLTVLKTLYATSNTRTPHGIENERQFFICPLSLWEFFDWDSLLSCWSKELEGSRRFSAL